MFWLTLIPAFALLFGCFKPPPPPPPVYLIMIDTLRVDALSCYGGKRPTPGLDRFAASAVLFEQCFASADWTVPSVASIWTGLYPFHHGTIRGMAQEGEVVRQETLNPAYVSIAKVFKQAGYRTYGVSANGHINAQYGFAEGFDEFAGFVFMKKEAVAASWAGLAPRVVAEQRFRQPTFVMMFFFDPHHPYTPQEPWASRYLPNWEKHIDRMEKEDIVDLKNEGYFQKHPDKIAVARAMYDSEVAALDAYLGDALHDLPGYDDAWVVLVADHGESFGEVGKMLHGNNLRQPEVHIPFMIKLPHNQLGGKRIAAPVSLVDILPTLADVIKAPHPPKMDGVSLLPLLMGRPAPSRSIFLHVDALWAQEHAMVQWPYKIIRTRHDPPVVYDLSRDPTEAHDLRRAHPEAYAPMERELDQGARSNIRFPPRVITNDTSPDMREKLRSLGYLR
jgi:arylsulfatase A-like enzyme